MFVSSPAQPREGGILQYWDLDQKIWSGLGTGISGLLGFTYDDIALDTTKQSRLAGTNVTGDSGTNASLGMSSGNNVNTPLSIDAARSGRGGTIGHSNKRNQIKKKL